MNYKLKLDVFEGPLDLLLYLIKKDELNIYDIPIAQITGQYLEYLEMLKIFDLDIIGDFLVMAATLMQIKSRMLLPPDPSTQEEEEEDPRDELVRRLLEYKRFKEIAAELQSKESFRQELFTRSLDTDRVNELREESREIYFEVSLFDLISAFTKALKNVPKDVIYEVMKDEHTVDQKIHDLLHLLLEVPRVKLNDLFTRAKTKVEVIVIFMAILELIRLKEVIVVQSRAFGEIEVLRNKSNMIPKELSEENPQASESPSLPENQQSPENPPSS